MNDQLELAAAAPYSMREKVLGDVIAGMVFGQKKPSKKEMERALEAARYALNYVGEPAPRL